MAESTLARRLRVKLQLRDKKGRWIEMGGGGKWLSGDGVMKSGIVIGSKGNTAILREKNADGTLGTKDVHVNMKQLEMIASKASLDANTLKLVNSFKNNQSAKGIKEADARVQALTKAKADLKSGKAPVDEAEVEYEATVAEELEDLLLDAPVGTKLEGSDFLGGKKKSKLAVTKAADGLWKANGYSNAFTSKEISEDGNFGDFRSTAADGKAINDLFDEASKNNTKGIFKKKNTAPKKAYVGVPVNNLDDIINATNAMLGKINEDKMKSQPSPAPQAVKTDAPTAPVASKPAGLGLPPTGAKQDAPVAAEAPKPAEAKTEAPASTVAPFTMPANPLLDSIINSTDAMLGKSHANQAKAAGPAPVQTAPEAPKAPEAAVDATPEAAPEAPEVPETAEAASDAPIDISGWKYHQGTQGGSNPGGIYTDQNGQDFYVKKSKSDMHAKNEVLADKFYEKLGVQTSQLKLADVGGGKLGTASAMVDGSKSDFGQKSKSDPEYLKKFQEDFAIDAWLANWDVVGLAYDNALTNANGDPVRIDPGGALLYRAMGDPKGDIFGAEVGEWDSMRKGSNPASKTFGSMTDDQLKASVAKLLNISDQDISDIVDSMEFDEEVSDFLKDTLASRRLNLLSKYPELGTKPQEAPAPVAEAPAQQDMPEAEAPAQKAMPEEIADTPEASPVEDSQTPSDEDESSQYGGGDDQYAPAAEDPSPEAEGISDNIEWTDYAKGVAEVKAAAQAGEIADFSKMVLPKHKPDPDAPVVLEWDDPDAEHIAAYDGFPGYTKADVKALHSYVQDSDEINWLARGKDIGYQYLGSMDNSSKKAADVMAMDNLLAKSVVSEDTSVFRGISMSNDRFQKFMESKMYSDLGFSSTSTDKELAEGWGHVNYGFQTGKTQVTLQMDLPAGFTAHRVMYSDDIGNLNFFKEKEVVLPRGTDFDITSVEEYDNGTGGKAYRLRVSPILTEKNYKPEGITNGQSDTEDTTAGELPGESGIPGNDGTSASEAPEGTPEDGAGGDGYADPDSGAGTGEEGSEPEAQGVEEPEVTPEAETTLPEEGNAASLTPEQFKDLPEGTTLIKKANLTDSGPEFLPYTKIGPNAWQRSDKKPSGYGDKGTTHEDDYFTSLSDFNYSLPSTASKGSFDDDTSKWDAIIQQKKDLAAAKKAADDAAKAEAKVKHEAWKEAQKSSPQYTPPSANTFSPEEFKDLPVGTRLEYNNQWGGSGENTYTKTGPNTWKSQDGTSVDGWGAPVMRTDDDSIFLEGGEQHGKLGNFKVALPGAWDKHMEEVKAWNAEQKAKSEAPADTAPEEAAPEAPEEVTPEAPEDVTPETSEEAPEAPEAPEEAAPEAPVDEAPATAEEEDIAPINGAQAILSMMAEKQGISLDQLKEDLGLPADGAFPNKGKTVSNENGDVFEANTIVSNPKFGEGIASIILPSTNSVKVLYKDHGYKVTQAKNLGLVNGTAPDEVAAEAVDLSTAKPGDVGTNPANGKMYFVGKNNKALYIGDEVEYTKKGVTQAGKVSSIYKGAKTVKVDFADGSSGVKKASQLVGNDKSSEPTNEDTVPATEAPAQAETVDTVEETETPEAAETVSEAPETIEAPATPETPEEAPEEAAAPATGENKGWSPLGKAYDPMGPTTVQVLPDLKSALVYPHDNSGNQKQDYAIKGLVRFNPVENKHFGVGHNLQPLYVGDNVDYLWLGQQYKGKITKIHPTTGSATIELEDGTMKMKKFSQLRGNQPKKVDVDENGNYTDWHGNAAKIPNISNTEDGNNSDKAETTPETTEAAPETPETAEETAPEVPEEVAPVVKPTYAEVWDAPSGQSITVDGEPFYKVGYAGHWSNPSVDGTLNHGEMTEKIASAGSAEMGAVDTHNMSKDRLEALGNGAKLVSAKLGLNATKDSDGDWLIEGAGYHNGEGFFASFPADDWVIMDKGAESITPTHTEEDLMFMNGGTTLTLGDKKFIKTSLNDGEDWLEPQWGNTWTNEDIIKTMGNSTEAPRFDGEPEANLSFNDLDEMKNGAEIYSEKLNVTLTKDSDGDWSAAEYSTGYMSDTQVLDTFHTDDWDVNSTGQVESNLSEYDLDSAPAYSELYSPAHEAYFTKMEDGDWENNSSGYTKSSDQLLEEYPDEEFSLTQAEIDESFSYGQQSSEFEDLPLGSKVNFTNHATEEPDEFIKIGEDKWATTDYSGKPVLHSAYGDGDFEDGYSSISHTAEEGEYTPPTLLEYESNTPDMDKDEITPEWVSSLPLGTKLKASLSNKWTYEKTEDGWTTLDEYGGVKNPIMATDDQMFKAAHGKSTLTKIFIPESEESSADTTPEETPVSVADFEVGTVVPLSDTTGITKTGDNEWKMSVNGVQIDQPLTDEFAQGVHDTLKPEVTKPVAPEAPEDVTPEVPEEVIPEAPEEVVPEAAAPAAGVKKMGSFDEDTFKNLPVGSTITTGADSAYTKNGENSWVAGNGVGYNDSDFIGLKGYGSASDWEVATPEGDAPAPAAAGLPAGSGLNEYTAEEFKNLPLGTVMQNTGGFKTKYTKTDDGWTATSNNGYTASYADDNFIDVMSFPSASNYKIHPNGTDAADPVESVDPVEAPTPETVAPAPAKASTKKLQSVDWDEFVGAPVGTQIISNGNGTEGTVIYTKNSEGKWDTGGGYGYSDNSFKEFVKDEGDNYTFKTPGDEAPEFSPKSMNELDFDSFPKLPVGTEMTTPISDKIYKKTGENSWVYGSDEEGFGTKTYEDDAFEAILNSINAPVYGLKVPEKSDSDNSDSVDFPLDDYTFSEFSDLPVGTVVTNSASGDVYTKVDPDKWMYEDLEVDNDAFSYLFNNNSEINNYSVNLPLVESVGSNSLPTVWAPNKTLNDVDYTELMEAPVGSTIKNKSGMTITKNAEGKWYSDSGMLFKTSDFVNYASTGMGKDFAVDLGESSKTTSTASAVTKGVALDTDTLDAYPVGTTLKQESPAYYVNPIDTYLVKLENGDWQQFKKTAKTLSAKKVMKSSSLGNYYGKYTVSKPTSSEHFVAGTGEIGYVGDSVELDDGQIGSVAKIMKTGLKIKLSSGDKITVKPAKVSKGDKSFGFIGNVSPTTPQPSQTSLEDDDTPSAHASNFAGADSSVYDEAGMVMPHNENPSLIPAYTLSKNHQPDVTNPLYGKPKPVKPVSPSAYPSFVAPTLELPTWDSEEWLKKVEQRYLDNPMKAKSTVQQSGKWGAIDSVLKGDQSNLDSLLESKYLDQDMYDEALAGMAAKDAENTALIAAHSEVVAEAKSAYDAKKATHFAEYNELSSKYLADFEEWADANPHPDALVALTKPPVSKESFTGGAPDWTKAHIGTHSAETVFSAIKADNALAVHGLSIATDSDKIKNLDVNVHRYLDNSGTEKLDVRFKVTSDHGKTLKKFFDLSAAKKSNTIYPPAMKKQPSGMYKEGGAVEGLSPVSGLRWELTHEETGAKIIFQRDTTDKKINNDTNHNSVRILMPTTSGAEDYQKVLEYLGIEGKPSTEGDIRVLAENRLLSLFAKDKDSIGGSYNPQGSQRDKALKRIKSDFGITPDDLILEADMNGRVEMHFSNEATEKLMSTKFSDIKAFQHNLTGGNTEKDTVNIWMSILTGANPGLASTYHRWSHGVGGYGMSSITDMGHGAGDYIYTTPRQSVPLPGGNKIVMHPAALIRRADVWANVSDKYGKKGHDGYDMGAIEKLAKHKSLHEYLPNSSVPVNDFHYISVASTSMRDSILEQLKAKGILQINGIDIEDFILTSGMTPPPSEYVLGHGAAPLGMGGPAV